MLKYVYHSWYEHPTPCVQVQFSGDLKHLSRVLYVLHTLSNVSGGRCIASIGLIS